MHDSAGIRRDSRHTDADSQQIARGKAEPRERLIQAETIRAITGSGRRSAPSGCSTCAHTCALPLMTPTCTVSTRRKTAPLCTPPALKRKSAPGLPPIAPDGARPTRSASPSASSSSTTLEVVGRLMPVCVASSGLVVGPRSRSARSTVNRLICRRLPGIAGPPSTAMVSARPSHRHVALITNFRNQYLAV